MDDGRLNRSPMDGLINQLQVPARGREGAEPSKANADVSSEEPKQDSGPAAREARSSEALKTTGTDGAARPGSLSQADTDPLRTSALPPSGLRADTPNVEARRPEDVPNIDPKGLADLDPKNPTPPDESLKVKHEVEASNEKILRDAHSGRVKDDRTEKASAKIEGEKSDPLRSFANTREPPTDKQPERAEKSIHITERGDDKNRSVHPSPEKSETRTVFKSETQVKIETKLEPKVQSEIKEKAYEPQKSVERPHAERREPNKLDEHRGTQPTAKDVKPERVIESQKIEAPQKDRTAIVEDKKPSIEQRADQRAEPRAEQKTEQRPEQKTDSRAEQRVEPRAEQKPDIRLEERPVVRSEDKVTEKNTEPKAQVVRDSESRESIKAEPTRGRDLSLEEKIERIVIPESHSESKAAVREEISIRGEDRREEIVQHEKISTEALRDKDPAVAESSEEHQVVAKEVFQERSETIKSHEHLIEESSGIVVERDGPNASSSGEAANRVETIALEHSTVEKIIEKIDEVTPTVSVVEGAVLSEVRGVIAEIIRLNDAGLLSGRDILPEDVSKLEALSDQLRSTVSQAVDELSRKLDKSYEEIVLLNELRVLLSELSRDPLLQLGAQIDDASLFEIKGEPPKPQNMLEEAYEKVKEVVTRLLGFGEGDKALLKEETPPPIIILREIIQSEKVEEKTEEKTEEKEEDLPLEDDEEFAEKEDLESKAARSVHTLSGEVLDSATKKGISGVAVYGGLLGVSVTDGEGQFTFENVQHGMTFMIGPDKKGYKFSPPFISGTATASERFTFVATKKA